MKSYSAEVEAQLVAGKIRRRLAIRFDLPSGSYGFVMGMAGSVTVGDVLYVGSGGLITLDLPEAGVSDQERPITVSLASHRKINGQTVQLFDPHLLDTIEDEVWYLRPAVIYRFWLSEGRALQDVEQLHLRQIYSIEHTRTRNGRRVEAVLQTPGALAKVREGKRNGPELQRDIDPTDTGLDDAITTGSDPIYWGQRAPAPGTGNA